MTGVMMFALRRLSLTMVVLAAFTLVACWGFSRGAPADGSVVVQAKVGATDLSCTGKPLQFTSILSLTGPLSVPSISTETKHATTAALKAVNSQCALGRPIAVDLCDDKSDPNAAQQCGLKAKSNGSLALFGSSGTFTNGTNAAQLPGIFTAGGTLFDLTNPNSFSSTSGLTLVLGGAGVAAGLHKKENLLVVVDTAATETFAADRPEGRPRRWREGAHDLRAAHHYRLCTHRGTSGPTQPGLDRDDSLRSGAVPERARCKRDLRQRKSPCSQR